MGCSCLNCTIQAIAAPAKCNKTHIPLNIINIMSHSFREHIKQSLAAIAFPIALTACTSEAYDSGDGTNSYLTADLVLLRTAPDKSVRSVQLDDGRELRLSNPSRRTG